MSSSCSVPSVSRVKGQDFLLIRLLCSVLILRESRNDPLSSGGYMQPYLFL